MPAVRVAGRAGVTSRFRMRVTERRAPSVSVSGSTMANSRFAVATDEIREAAESGGAPLATRSPESAHGFDREQHQAEAQRVAPRPLELLAQPLIERH